MISCTASRCPPGVLLGAVVEEVVRWAAALASRLATGFDDCHANGGGDRYGEDESDGPDETVSSRARLCSSLRHRWCARASRGSWPLVSLGLM
jgi:hypothetical protein